MIYSPYSSTEYNNLNNVPITLSWSVNAFIRNKTSLIQKLKGKKKIQPIDDASLYYDSNTNTYFDMSKTSKQANDDGIKYILKDGKFSSKS